jgi:hypothetical protein
MVQSKLLRKLERKGTILDHDQRYTVSAGASYTYRDTTVYADLLYGSGLRSGFANTDELPGYYPLNVGFTHDFHLPESTAGFGFASM